MSLRTLSSESLSFSFSTSFSWASVGPKPWYLVLSKFKAFRFTSSDKRLFAFRPRCLDTRPAAPCSRNAFRSRLICRVLSFRIGPASFWFIFFWVSLWITSNRLNSLALILSSLSISCPFEREHFNFAEKGHFYFGLTKIDVRLTKLIFEIKFSPQKKSRSGGIGRRATFRA